MEKILMSVKEVAEYLGVCQMTVYRHAERGKIPAIKIGRLWKFRKKIIEKWLIRLEKER